MDIYVGPEFWLGNARIPDMLYIDFDDGQGVQAVPMGSTVQINRGAIGRPHTSPPTTPHLAVSGAHDGEAIQVGYDGPALGGGTQRWQAATALSLLTTASIAPDVALGIVATRRWQSFTPPANKVSGPNGLASAIAWIKYADDNPALPNGSHLLRRPLVFVEGIDFADYRNNAGNSGKNHAIIATGPLPLSDFTTGPAQDFGGYRNGEAGWNEMVDYNANYKSLEKFADLRAQLQAPRGQTGFPNGVQGGGYDIIYFDFSDGAGLIQHNAMALATLLELINTAPYRAPDADETIVIGASMGGQVARFALAWMEQQGLCHHSKLYVSFDSPHRGANVPIGLQYLFDRLQGASSSAEDMVQNKLRREATEQMVVFHFANEATPFRNNWQAWQASPNSYPSLLRKVAVANGSGQAAFSPDMSPGMLMLRTSVNPLRGVPYIVGTNYSYALGRGDYAVFRYQRPFSAATNTITSDPNWGNFDTAPGCRERTAGDAQDESGHSLVSGGDFNTFMPTISTLDVKDAGPINNPNFGYNVQQQIRPDRPNPLKYAFDAYFSAGPVNEPHVQITNGQGSSYSYPYNTSYFTDNSAWIQNELQESAHRMPATLSTVYNYGNAYRHLLPSVQINQGGHLYINKENLPVSGGTSATQAAPAAAGTFEVYTPGCNTAVRVNAGGLLTVGGDINHQANLQISPNSILDIEAGGQVVVESGSRLHVVAGGTLVMHQGSTLQGYVELEAGAYLCTESGTTVGSSSSAISNAAIYGINPQLLNSSDLTYLNLGAVACSQPGFQVHITSYATNYQCVSRSGNPNYAQWTATVQSGTGPYSYAWYLDPTGSGNNYQPAPNGSLVLSSGNTSTLGLCLNAYAANRYVVAKVVVTNSAGQQASDSFYGMPQMFLYPNPADSYADFTADDNAGGASAARSTAAAGGTPPLGVTVYNGQGSVVFTAADVITSSVRLPTSTWPSGLYQVRTQQGKTVKTQQLSVQH